MGEGDGMVLDRYYLGCCWRGIDSFEPSILEAVLPDGMIESLAGGSFRLERRAWDLVLKLQDWAHNSAVECHLHTVEVVGSNPAVPTIKTTT